MLTRTRSTAFITAVLLALSMSLLTTPTFADGGAYCVYNGKDIPCATGNGQWSAGKGW